MDEREEINTLNKIVGFFEKHRIDQGLYPEINNENYILIRKESMFEIVWEIMNLFLSGRIDPKDLRDKFKQ